MQAIVRHQNIFATFISKLRSHSCHNNIYHDIENEAIQIEVFEFAYLDNDHKVVIRASPNYYGQAVFLDVCIEMDESELNDYSTDNDGLCYAKVLLILQVSSTKLEQNLDLILVQ
ncbi:unnamed protein product [Rhizophagus irregularis]|nr:unnamed protein product [Rhizophagus irregularis]